MRRSRRRNDRETKQGRNKSKLEREPNKKEREGAAVIQFARMGKFRISSFRLFVLRYSVVSKVKQAVGSWIGVQHVVSVVVSVGR